MKIYALCLALVILALGACGRYSGVEGSLDEIERLLEIMPDSALAIASRINMEECGKKNKARHALLLTIAQDRNYITPLNDSVINIAVNYYDTGSKERMIADYYSGRIYLRNGMYRKTVESLLDAEESALRLGDSRQLGLIYRELAYFFSEARDRAKSRLYAGKAYEAFRSSGDSLLVKFGALEYGRAEYFDENGYERGVGILDSVLMHSMADTPIDLFLRAEALRVKASPIIKLHYPHFIREQFKESTKISEHFAEYFPADFFKTDNVNGPSDYCADYPGKSGVSLIYVSEKYVKEIHRQLNNLGLELYFREWEVAGPGFEFPDYYAHFDSEYDSEWADNYISYRHNRLLEKEKSIGERWRLAIIVVIVTIMLFVAAFSLKSMHYRRMRNKYVADASELRDMLKSKDQSINGLQDYLDSLYGENFRLLEELCDMFILPSKHSSEQKRIYENVQSIVDGFKMDGKRLSEIEKYVNRYKGDVVSRFRADFPGLPERDYVLFLYLAAGFSRPAIAFFMNDSMEVISNRKTRLKKRILASSNSDNEMYFNAIR